MIAKFCTRQCDCGMSTRKVKSERTARQDKIALFVRMAIVGISLSAGGLCVEQIFVCFLGPGRGTFDIPMKQSRNRAGKESNMSNSKDQGSGEKSQARRLAHGLAP